MRICKGREVREEPRLILWFLLSVIVWTAVVEEGFLFARWWGGQLRVERAVVESRDESRVVVAAGGGRSNAWSAPPPVPPQAMDPVELPPKRLAVAPGQLRLGIVSSALVVEGGRDVWPLHIELRNEGDTPIMVMHDTSERGFAHFVWTIRTEAGDLVAPRQRSWRCGLGGGTSLVNRTFLLLNGRTRHELRVSSPWHLYDLAPGVYWVGLRYRVDPTADRVDEETVPRTRERGGGTFDEPGTARLLAQVSPVEVEASGEVRLYVKR